MEWLLAGGGGEETELGKSLGGSGNKTDRSEDGEKGGVEEAETNSGLYLAA